MEKKFIKKTFQAFSFLFVFLLNTSFVFAENFRTSKTHITEIEAVPYFETYTKLGINDSLVIYIPEDLTYLEGIEIKMSIPEEIAPIMDCVSCSFYDNVNPTPSTSQIDYSASLIYEQNLPSRLSWMIQIPLVSKNSLKSNRYTTKLDSIPEITQGYVFLRLQPVNQNITEEMLNAKIDISVKPILTNSGLLELKLSGCNDVYEKNTVYIDDEPQNIPDDRKFLLSSGIHNISIISEEFRDEVRTVKIDSANTTVLEIEMRSIEPSIILLAPDGTEIFLDNNPIETVDKEINITEGDHKIKFCFGDYEILRNITIQKGKTYTVSLFMDIQIIEN